MKGVAAMSRGRAALGLVLVAGVASTLQGCADRGDDVPEGTRVTYDTIDGVPHVISGSRGAWVTGGAWKVPAQGGVRIGEMDGPEPYTFGRVAGAVVAEDGRIYVGDTQSLDVRVFSPAGEFLFRFGREGEGPGELTNISGLGWAPDGIAVLDGRQGRVSVFDHDGAFLRSFRLARPYMIFEHHADMRFDDDGRFYDRARLSAAPMVDSIGVIVYSPEGEPADTFLVATIDEDHLVVERDGVPVMSFPRPFSPRPAMATGPDGRTYFTRSDRYHVHVLAPNGDTLRVLRRPLEPRPVTAEERDSATALIEERYRQASAQTPPRDIDLPETKPLIAELEVDREGNLWIGMYGDPRWSYTEWAVHAPDGRYLGPVAMPAMTVADIGADYVAGVEADSMGVERVVVYRVVK